MSNTDASFARPAIKPYTPTQLEVITASISRPANRVLKIIRKITGNKKAEVHDLGVSHCRQAVPLIRAIPKLHERHSKT